MNNIEKAIATIEAEKKRQYDLLDALPPKSRDRAIEITRMIQACEFGIAAMEQQLTNGWIPVSDHLPEVRHHEGGELIEFNIMLLGGTVPTTGCINNDGIWGWMDWNTNCFNPLGIHVIAWQPLPEPYKEGKDADNI